MKKLFYICLLVGLYSCGPRMYTYKFSMKETEMPDRLYYENDTLSLKFQFYLQGLMIRFSNKSGMPIKIKWDEIRITENGLDKKIEHVKITEDKNYIYKPPSIFPPKSVCNDLVVYADNIYYLKEYGKEKLKIKDMYPTDDRKQNRNSILSLKGLIVTLHFPIEIKNVSRSWVFNFLIADITSKRKPGIISASGVIGAAFEVMLTSLSSF